MPMAKDDIFEIEWEGLEEMSKLLDKMDKEIDQIIIEEYTELAMTAEEGAKALVHHDEGTLEDSINFDPARREGRDIVSRGGTNVEYALQRHERPGVGPGTANKPSWRGHQPGPKYLENAMKAIESDYDKANARILERVLGDDL